MSDPLVAAADLLDPPGRETGALLPHQVPPVGDDWDGWMLLGGRGGGKTYALTRYLREAVRDTPDLRARIIAPTLDDAISSCVYGPSGIMALDPTVTFHASAPGGAVLRWPEGAECRLIGTPTPREVDRLRASGNRELDLWEELAANPMVRGEETGEANAWTQAAMGRRIGRPRWVAATTPRPLPLLKRLVADERVVVTRATLRDNPHTDEGWRAAMEATYSGTRLYRQEIEGQIIDLVEGALWRADWLDRSRVVEPPGLVKAAVGVDPASGTGTTGIVAAALGVDQDVYVLEDSSQTNVSAERWASTVALVSQRWDATVVAEDNQGGDMVRAVLKAADQDMTVKPARAGRSKRARAEPVALLWEKDPPSAHMVRSLPRLEDELTTWIPGEGESPNRLDALVWAVTWLAPRGPVEITGPSTQAHPAGRRAGGLAAARRGG